MYDFILIELCIDPLDWTNEHVASWLKWCVKQLELWPIPRPEDFPNTGYELCSLSRTEFDRRSRNRRSGRLLLLHLSLLRQSVTGTPPSPSLTSAEEGMCMEYFLLNLIVLYVVKNVHTS